jgi:hypothetical protein
MKAPHPGLVAAIALAGGVKSLGKIIGKHHNYITYRMNRGRGLPDDLAAIAGQTLGIRASNLTDKEQ